MLAMVADYPTHFVRGRMRADRKQGAASSLPPVGSVQADWGKHKHTILVLQGGGALGAYQAGVYEGLIEAGLAPEWVTGVSIGAINAALIAGNRPDRRVERLREFWDRVSSRHVYIPPALLDPVRPGFSVFSAASAAAFGVPGFFLPRMVSASFAPPGSAAALSLYQTGPLTATLTDLIDFDLINARHLRLSLGSVNVRTGNSVYFDNMTQTLGEAHVRASGALPPGFAPVHIDGEDYWDGGIVSNTPLWYVLDAEGVSDALILQVDLFSARGPMPVNLPQVLERVKDIQYSSKTRFNTTRVAEAEAMHLALRKLLDKLPRSLRNDPDVQQLRTVSRPVNISIVHFINRHRSHAADAKDYEFSRATINELWAAGLRDVRDSVSRTRWRDADEIGPGIRVYDMLGPAPGSDVHTQASPPVMVKPSATLDKA